jgi:mannose-1-phosphate guanylyltransferase
MYASILAGGVGSRLWPRSRQSHPKQFSDITGDGQTMIQATRSRLDGLVEDSQIYVITGSPYAALAMDQLPQLPPDQIIAEPSGRNTAPAIGLACVHLYRRDPNAILAILPADHVVHDEEQFQNALSRAAEVAETGYLVTLGIEPTVPHTGYGYIQRDEPIREAGSNTLPAYRVSRFLEKPDHATAEKFLSEGGYYWNGGIFICRVDVMLVEMEKWLPEMYGKLQEIGAGLDGKEAEEVLLRVWAEMPNISIDYGIMEQAQKVAVVPLHAGWNDVGSWDALDDVLIPDSSSNRITGSDVIAIESYNNIIYCGDKMVALIGVDDLVVVDTGDALLIGHKKQMQKVKDIVNTLSDQERADLL